MNSKQFKQLFLNRGKEYGFEMKFGGLFWEAEETVFVTYLQKSNFGDYFQHIIKVYVQGVFMKSYIPSKNLVTKEVGHIRAGDLMSFRDIYNFDKNLGEIDRVRGLDQMFETYILPLARQMSDRREIKNLHDAGEIRLLPAIEKEIIRLIEK